MGKSGVSKKTWLQSNSLRPCLSSDWCLKCPSPPLQLIEVYASTAAGGKGRVIDQDSNASWEKINHAIERAGRMHSFTQHLNGITNTDSDDQYDKLQEMIKICRIFQLLPEHIYLAIPLLTLPHTCIYPSIHHPLSHPLTQPNSRPGTPPVAGGTYMKNTVLVLKELTESILKRRLRH